VRQLLRDESEEEVEAAKELVTTFWNISHGIKPEVPEAPAPAETSV
jgi:hypothetical protein